MRNNVAGRIVALPESLAPIAPLPRPPSRGTTGRSQNVGRTEAVQDLKRRTIVAFLWGAGGTTLRIAIQILSQIILARLLGPEQFGLFASGLVIVFFTNLIADGGLVYGLVQKPEVSDEDIRFIFTWQMLLSALIALTLFAVAPLLASAFGDDRLTTVIRYLSVSSLVTSAGSTSAALLRRRLDFRTLNIAAVVSYAVAFLGIGLPLAFAGFQALSLVAAFLSQAAIASAITYAAVRHPLRPLFRYAGVRHVIGFGATVFVTNIVNWVVSSLDRAIVSAVLGVTAAGLYSTVNNLISVPALSLLSVLQPVFYAATANVQRRTESLRSGLATMLSATMLFAAPVFVAISIAAGTVVATLLGAKWNGGDIVLAPLALAVPAILLMGLSTPVMWNAGYQRREFQIQLPLAAIWIMVCYAAAKFGSLALVSWMVTLLYFIRAVAIVGCTMLIVEMKPRDLVPLFTPGLIVSGLVALVAFIVDRGLAGAPAPARLAAVIACCGVAQLGGIALMRGRLPPVLVDLLARLADMLPARLAPARLVDGTMDRMKRGWRHLRPS